LLYLTTLQDANISNYKRKLKTNQMLKTLIVEDNFSFALELEIILKKLDYNILKTVDNSGDALVEILSTQPDIIFMDIDIKGKLSGLDIAQKIKHLNIPILFITSFADEEHYNISSQIPNSSYITKPADEFTIRSSVELLLKINQSLRTQNLSKDYKVESDILYLKKKENFYAIKHDEIVYIESNHVYCKTVTNSGEEYLNRIGLNEYSAILKDENFIRPHRSYLANTIHITKVNMNESVIILGKNRVPISRNAKKEMKSLFNLIT